MGGEPKKKEKKEKKEGEEGAEDEAEEGEKANGEGDEEDGTERRSRIIKAAKSEETDMFTDGVPIATFVRILWRMFPQRVWLNCVATSSYCWVVCCLERRRWAWFRYVSRDTDGTLSC